MKERNETVGVPQMEKPTLYSKIKETLALASQLIITAPLQLPPKLVTVAKYVALALGVLEAVEGAAEDRRKEMKTNQQLGIGTTGGTLLSVVGQLDVNDVLRTAVLAVIGAAVSFAVTLLLQRWRRGRR